MKPEDKDTPKGSSFWGIFCSIALHVVVLILVLFWGFRSTMQDSSPGPIEVSLSELGTGGGGGGARSRPAPPPPPPAPAEPEPEPEPEPPAPPKEEVAKVPPPEPEKEPEPKKEEPKEVAKVEPDKKVIPIEPEKKPEKTPEPKPEKKEVKKETPAPKKEPEKKEVKKEVAKKPAPTEKPKTEKKTTAKAEKNLESEKSKVLQDLKRQKVLDNLKREPSEEPTEMEEPMGEEQRLAMADTEGIPDKPAGAPGESSSRSGSGGGGREGGGGGGGSAVNPVLLDIYKKKVHQRIRRNWRIPPGVPTDGNLATLVFFKVDGSGRVFDVRVSKSSGNSAFDQFSLDAIQKSAPLPVPPSEFAAQAQSEGMEITFYNRPY